MLTSVAHSDDYVTVWYRYDDIVALLIDIGGVSARHMNGDQFQTPLYTAAQHGHVDVGRVLLDRGASTEGTNAKRNTALHIAAGGTRVEFVRLLLSRGALVDAVNSQNRTPLHYACCAPCPDEKSASQNDADRRIVMQMLLDHGAELNRNGDYGTPLQEAIDDCVPDSASFLRDVGARAEQGAMIMSARNGSMGSQGSGSSMCQDYASYLSQPRVTGGPPPAPAPASRHRLVEDGNVAQADVQAGQLMDSMLPRLPPDVQQQLRALQQQGMPQHEVMVHFMQMPFFLAVAQQFGSGQEAMAEAFKAILEGNVDVSAMAPSAQAVQTPPNSEEQQERVVQLTHMGFDEDRSRAALMQYNWNVEEAIAALLG